VAAAAAAAEEEGGEGCHFVGKVELELDHSELGFWVLGFVRFARERASVGPTWAAQPKIHKPTTHPATMSTTA
jgi:hypothetical protein